MAKIISRASLNVDTELVIDEPKRTIQFPAESTCGAIVYDKHSKALGISVEGTRDTDDSSFEVMFSKSDTELWDGNCTVVVTVSYSDGVIAAKNKLLVKAEKFG